MTRFSLAGAALTAASLVSLVSAVEHLSVAGANFVNNATGARFPILGVDYQPGGSSGYTTTYDPLADPDACLRDAILMQRLGINTIRVYNLASDLNHDECASIFNAAGIYMIIDVNSGLSGQYIDRSDPSSTYTKEYLERVFSVVEAFSNYPNTLGYFAGNEIINEQSSTDVPKYIRAVVRDMKDYIAANLKRSIGVGYSAADVASQLTDTWNYLGCGLANSPSSKIDFFGLNDYEWCGDATFESSGYSKLVTMFATTDIPVFFSEYGCNNVKPRTFTNVPVLFGSEMSVLSGGLVYEFTAEAAGYGLVAINSTKEATLLIDYSFLEQEYAKIDIKTLTAVNETAESLPVSACDASMITGSDFYKEWDIPSRPDGVDDIIKNGISNKPTGNIVTVSATDMPATIYNYTGAKVEGLKLVVLSSGDSNYPGLTRNYSGGATASNTTTSGKDSAAVRGTGGASGTVGAVFAVLLGVVAMR